MSRPVKKKNRPLVLATGYHVRARPLWDGRVDTGDLKLKVVPFESDGERHRRFLAGDFDASELSLALYLALKSNGAPLVAIPVFPNRRFRYSFIYLREDSPIREAADLRGKAVGVPSYLNTCGLWARGLLGDEYGLKTRDMAWKVIRKEAVDFTPPPGAVIESFSGKRDLRARLLKGEVDALITPDVIAARGIRRLFSYTKELEMDYFRRTGIFPINHAIVIREQVARDHPLLARRLYKIWDEAKRLALADDEDPTFSNFVWIRDLWEEEREMFGGDPWRYGMAANEKVIKTLIRYGVEQGIASAKIDSETLFLRIA
ncbi:MAG TPA: PhnD/SsuA/transferrin family substrate-binding protein [Candidatus Binatia bacterium]|jgi:4,5-dihydroxyphthalate decarboxylase